MKLLVVGIVLLIAGLVLLSHGYTWERRFVDYDEYGPVQVIELRNMYGVLVRSSNPNAFRLNNIANKVMSQIDGSIGGVR